MQGAESTVEIFLARSYTDPYAVVLARWLVEDIQPKVAEELKRLGVTEPFRFIEATEPSGDQLVPEKVGTLIRQARGLLALCLPDARGRISNWVLGEIGYAYAHGKAMRAFFTPGADPADIRRVDPQNDLAFLSHAGGEAFPVALDEFDASGRSRTKFDNRVVDYLVKWVRSILHLTEVTGSYCYRQYLKDVTVFGDGYGFVRFHVLVDVAREIDFIPHCFGCGRPKRVPKLATLSDTFRRGGALRRPPKDFFNFRPLPGNQALLVLERKWSEMPDFIRKNVPEKANARFFGVQPPATRGVAPGTYEYEYCYGLLNMFPEGFGPDETSALVSQAVVLDGSMGVRFMCESDEDFEVAQRLEVMLQCGQTDQGGFASRAPKSEEKQVTGLGVSYLFRRVMRPSPQNGTPIIVRWGPAPAAPEVAPTSAAVQTAPAPLTPRRPARRGSKPGLGHPKPVTRRP